MMTNFQESRRRYQRVYTRATVTCRSLPVPLQEEAHNSVVKTTVSIVSDFVFYGKLEF